MDKKFIKFDKIEIENHKLHKHENPISIYDVHINKILVFKRIALVKMVLNTLLAEKVRPLWVMLPKMSIYRRDFDEAKYMSFSIKNEERYNEIWNNVSNTFKKMICQ